MGEQDGGCGSFYAEKSDWPKLEVGWTYELLCLDSPNWRRPFRDQGEAKTAANYQMRSNRGHNVVVTPISPRSKS